ncbi:19172_t:CDS:2 [Racocetra fulgida]|uniref:19172_t:CDS:1 n=1 Tax=Racocetra fulgida TaxID=60492 RepID=A0A9N9GES9_9GLOM|nr:19172_t:CDS:2 [Racocetra fulgida]
MLPVRRLLPRTVRNAEDIRTDSFIQNQRFRRIQTSTIKQQRGYKIGLNFQETTTAVRHLLKLPRICPYCNAKLFAGETDYGLDQRTYNIPTASQVAAIWVEGHESIDRMKRDIILFAIILIFGEPGNVQTLWNNNFVAMSEDFMKSGILDDQRHINAVLLHIKIILEQHHKKLTEFDLPPLDLSEK